MDWNGSVHVAKGQSQNISMTLLGTTASSHNNIMVEDEKEHLKNVSVGRFWRLVLASVRAPDPAIPSAPPLNGRRPIRMCHFWMSIRGKWHRPHTASGNGRRRVMDAQTLLFDTTEKCPYYHHHLPSTTTRRNRTNWCSPYPFWPSLECPNYHEERLPPLERPAGPTVQPFERSERSTLRRGKPRTVPDRTSRSRGWPPLPIPVGGAVRQQQHWRHGTCWPVAGRRGLVPDHGSCRDGTRRRLLIVGPEAACSCCILVCPDIHACSTRWGRTQHLSWAVYERICSWSSQTTRLSWWKLLDFCENMF